ncbi:hypothetical protein GGI26_002889 [Coemansia sp. RSA 1358]|nr:hypothetical protein GGI26_002889 [Coemansia sp. RSA 1358]
MVAATNKAHFDFIIVGGGTAGNTVTGRLAENRNVTYKTTMIKRDDYKRIKKSNTRGKILGGSSSLNYFIWVPGCKPTFDG